MNKERIDISIIIPVYNMEHFLGECLQSVLSQDYEHYETIIINDGSTDKSHEIIEKYCTLDSRFVCINQENKGVSEARNTGIDAARGRYLMFLDSDDAISKDTLSDLMPIALSGNPDIIHLNCNRIPYNPRLGAKIEAVEKDMVLNKREIMSHFAGNLDNYCYVFYIFKASLLADNNIRFKTKFAEDILFNLQAILHCETIYFTKKEYYFYRANTTGATSVFFGNDNLINERNKSTLEMLKVVNALATLYLTSSQAMNLRRCILQIAVNRFDAFQNTLFSYIFKVVRLPEDTRLAIWGAGRRAERLIRAIIKSDVTLADIVIVDNNPYRQGDIFYGYPVISPEDMANEQYTGYKNVITPRNGLFEFYAQMKNMGLVSSMMDLRLDVGENKQYDMQLKVMDELFNAISEMGIEFKYLGE